MVNLASYVAHADVNRCLAVGWNINHNDVS